MKSQSWGFGGIVRKEGHNRHGKNHEKSSMFFCCCFFLLLSQVNRSYSVLLYNSFITEQLAAYGVIRDVHMSSLCNLSSNRTSFKNQQSSEDDCKSYITRYMGM
uniref:Uncharacterized protein n=1 Tax=Cacopsylla melanoneura TaxID=428564 RepID=A0A8D8RHD7_9HEMI